MSGHTPGPWSVGNSRKQPVDSKMGAMWEAAVHVGSEANRGNSLASVHMGGLGALYSTKEAVEANARLIAAAPDLVVALQTAALCLDDMEAANAMMNRDMMAATCLVISNEIRNALIKAGVNVPPVKAGAL